MHTSVAIAGMRAVVRAINPMPHNCFMLLVKWLALAPEWLPMVLMSQTARLRR